MTVAAYSAGGIAYDRDGPIGEQPVVLLHARIADRRMWDPLWTRLTERRDVIRADLRGYGESVTRPAGLLSPVEDILGLLNELNVGTCHLVGASFGAGVAVEIALTDRDRVTSLLLSAPGGALIAQLTPDLGDFIAAENAALGRGDLDAAVEANVAWWVDGRHRDAAAAPGPVREAVRRMQRREFEVTADWDDIDEAELDPPALERLASLHVPTLVLTGELDLDAIAEAARRVVEQVPNVRLVRWPDVAHLPSMERPDDFYALVSDWLREVEG